MANKDDEWDDERDDFDDDEGPQSVDLDDLGDDDEEDEDDEDDDGVAVCPNCEAPIYEDAERCGRCGQYITPTRRDRAATLPWWGWLILLAGAAAMVYFLVK